MRRTSSPVRGNGTTIPNHDIERAGDSNGGGGFRVERGRGYIYIKDGWI